MKVLLQTAALALACTASAFAQEAPPSSSGADEAEIVVTAPTPELLQEFVGEMTANPMARTLARWDRSICTSVLGMNAPHAQFMIDRIAATAIRLGLEPGQSGCRPNITIFMTYEAEAFAQQIADHPRLISRRNRYGNTRGREALREFAETPRAVRWWHMSETVTGDGFVVARGSQVRVRQVGRVRGNLRQDLSQAFIVIDANRIDGVRLDTLSDYVAMAALAQLDPNADFSGLPTVLSVFGGGAASGEAPVALTGWDVGYLEALYSTTRDARSASEQEADIARRMAD
jgi:hypothetical protein